jgi:RHS repeat-associated protein
MTPKTLARFVCCLLLSVFTSISTTLGQEASNKRGFQPGHSYALGDIETINTTNGNVMLHFPLASLPTGHGGLSGAINLVYSSKLYDAETAYFRDQSQQCTIADDHIVNCPYYTKSLVRSADEGGWHYGVGFGLQLKDRRDQYANVSEENKPVCRNQFGGLEAGYNEMTYVYKLRIRFPDGSTHEVRPSGFHDGFAGDAQADYFDVRPDGWRENCGGNGQWFTGPISYYSTDGSFLRLDVQHDGDQSWWTNPWTLYLPDGTRVTSGASGPQRIYDRNDNYIEIGPIQNYNGTGHSGTQLSDQFGRSIILEENGAGPGEDKIIAAGFGGTVETTVKWKQIQVNKTYWPCPLGGCSFQITQPQAFNETLSVVDRITLPVVGSDVLHYDFSYNAPDSPSTSPSAGWGELNGITLPSQAHVSYQFAQDGISGSNTPDILRNAPTHKTLSYNEEHDGSLTPITEQWTYNILGGASTVTGPDGGETTEFFNETSGSFWDSGLTYQTILPDGRKIERIWKRNNLENYTDIFRGDNPYVKTEYTSIKNAAGNYVKTAIKDYQYDQNGNITRIAEYDWVDYNAVHNSQDQPTGFASLQKLRATVNDYHNATAAACDNNDNCQIGNGNNIYWKTSAPRLKNELFATEIFNALDQSVARTELHNDAQGNLLEQKMWDSVSSSYLSILNEYEDWANGAHGRLMRTFDARGTKTEFKYEAVGTATDLYPTKVETAKGTTIQRTETRQYDQNTGLLTLATDVDNDVSTKTTYDLLGRPRLVQAAFGKPEETRTVTEYLDLARRVVVRSDLTTMGDEKLVSITHYDPLGRVRLQRQLEDASESGAETSEEIGIKVQTRYRYDAGHSYILTSNPYRAANSTAAASETSMGWTLTTSDVSGRVVQVQTFTAAADKGLPVPLGNNNLSTGIITTSYDANFTTVTDQAQKQRRSQVDALGRLRRVDEPACVGTSPCETGQLGSLGSPLQPTDYEYDALGNLTKVQQDSQLRTFTYSSLSRLTSAQNPESGLISYKYDANGNLKVKTDARGVSTHYNYDQLNRVLARWYNSSAAISDTVANGSPALPSTVGLSEQAIFSYDSHPVNSPFVSSQSTDKLKGRLTAVTYGSGNTTGDYYRYDLTGRLVAKVQRIGNKDYSVAAEYNRAGALTALTYPSGRIVHNDFDGAGRLNAVTGNLGDNQSRTYSTGIVYTANGALAKEKFGTDTPIYNKLFYNSRGQLAEIRESTGYTGPGDTTWDRGAIINFYSNQCWGMCAPDENGPKAMTDNNGNLRRQEVYVPGSLMRFQTYSYDSLSRLQAVEEKTDGDSAVKLRQTFKYDRWGNRTIDKSCVDGTTNSGCVRWTFGGVNDQQFEVETSTNRLLAVGDTNTTPTARKMRYDQAGNLVNDAWSSFGTTTPNDYTRFYDGENRMVSALDSGNGNSVYTYDASGQRVKRKTGNVETWQVYGIGGELLAEYPQDGTASTPQKEYGYRNGQMLITAEPAQTPTARQNFALRSNGSVARASSELSSSCLKWQARGVIDGDRKATNWGSNGGWANSTGGNAPSEWLEIEFKTTQAVDELDIFTLRDQFLTDPSTEPNEAMTFNTYGLTAWTAAYWNGSAWIDIPEASISGNNKVWRKITLSSPVNTNKIRIYPHAAVDNGYYRLTEVEAWGNSSPAPKTNVALRSNGGKATASSELGSGCSSWPARGVNDGDRQGLYWGETGGWADSSSGTFANDSDWVQLEFNGIKTIDEIDVFTVRDDFSNNNPAELTEASTFLLYGLTAFDVSYWNGTTWVPLPETVVTNNNKVWRKLTLSTPIATSKIRVFGRAAIDNGYSRIAEVEAWSPNQAASANAIHWLVADQLGTPRMIFDQSGVLANVKRHDYLPFGEELFAGVNDRLAAEGYGCDPSNPTCAPDNVRQQFTTKERDNETALDYFGARYYSSAQGRFSSPDPLLSSGRSTQPQSWNRYSYVLNRPLMLVDPTGLDWGVTEWVKEGVRHLNYHYFSGKVGSHGGREYKSVSFGKSGQLDIAADDGSIVRISNSGVVWKVIYNPPGPITSTGGATLSIGAGLANSAFRGLASLVPGGKVGAVPVDLVAEHSFESMAGVDPNSNAYRNGQIVGTGLIVAGSFALPIPRISNPEYVLWTKTLAFESFEAELMAGGGEIIAGSGSGTTLRDAPRLAAEYGGNVADWAKTTSKSFEAVDGSVIAAHGYKNTVTGKVVEIKGVIDKYPFK